MAGAQDSAQEIKGFGQLLGEQALAALAAVGEDEKRNTTEQLSLIHI